MSAKLRQLVKDLFSADFWKQKPINAVNTESEQPVVIANCWFIPVQTYRQETYRQLIADNSAFRALGITHHKVPGIGFPGFEMQYWDGPEFRSHQRAREIEAALTPAPTGEKS